MNARRLWILGAVTASLIVVGASAAFPQMGQGRRARGALYNVQTETTVQGTVEEVRTVSGPRGWNGVHLALKSDSGEFDVHLGPEAFLKEKDFRFAKGDQIEVTGSKVNVQGQDAILAREVKKGDKTLTLRNAQGVPEWAGRRRR